MCGDIKLTVLASGNQSDLDNDNGYDQRNQDTDNIIKLHYLLCWHSRC